MAREQILIRITVPGLSVTQDFTAARQRLLSDFPDIAEVLATTAPGTLLVLSSHPEDVDAWVDALYDSIATRRSAERARRPAWRLGRMRGDDSAA
jgi:hypothetical protein